MEDNEEEVKVAEMVTEEKKEKEEKTKDENRKLILIIVVAGLVAFILLILIISMLIKGNKPKNTPNDTPTTNGTTEKEEIDPDLAPDTRKRIPRTENMLYLYVVDGELVEDAYCDDACKGKQYGYVNFEIAELDARVLDIAPSAKYEGKFPDYILYKDGDKIKYFNISQFRSYSIGLSSEYVKYKTIEYNGKLEAVYFKKKGENGIYSLLSNKSLYVNKYDKYEVLSTGLITGIKGENKEILSLYDEKVIDNIELETLNKLTKKEQFNILEENVSDEKVYTIYSNNYNEIISKISAKYTYFEGDKVYLIKDGSIYGYDNTGKEIYKNNLKHDDILMIVKGYYVAMNNNYFELRELNGDKVVLKDNILGYKLNYYQSGYKDKSDLTKLTGRGIYISFIKEQGGTVSIVEEYYNPTTGESQKDTATK